jgi:hypothetical protein
MSLAMFAASFDDNSNITLPNNDNSDNILNQKRHKRTQRKYPKIENFDVNKVNLVMSKIHNTTDDDEDDDDDKNTFNPPPKPESMGALKTIPPQQKSTESFVTPLGRTIGKTPTPNYEGSDNLDLNNYSNYGNSKSIEEYYKSVIPGYTEQQKNLANRPHHQYSQPNSYENTINEYTSQDVLLKKLNYMISLLEEQQDEKTSNVTEEVILYSFLGIFIIFMADTFVRAGKYTR